MQGQSENFPQILTLNVTYPTHKNMNTLKFVKIRNYINNDKKSKFDNRKTAKTVEIKHYTFLAKNNSANPTLGVQGGLVTVWFVFSGPYLMVL